jgi:hypothetical protein
MCYSAPVSLAAFICGLVFSILLVTTGTPTNTLYGLFFAFVSLMQGIEYLLWSHQTCDSFHKYLSIAGMLLNHAQPLVLIALSYAIFRRNGPLLLILALVYATVFIPYSAQYLSTEKLQCTTPASCENPHLLWNWNNLSGANTAYGVFIAVFVLTALFGFPSLADGWPFAIGAILTYGVSNILYPRESVGALWCFWVAFIPAVLYLRNML